MDLFGRFSHFFNMAVMLRSALLRGTLATAEPLRKKEILVRMNVQQGIDLLPGARSNLSNFTASSTTDWVVWSQGSVGLGSL